MSANLTVTELELYRQIAATAERLVIVINSADYIPREETMRDLAAQIADALVALAMVRDCAHPPEALTMAKDDDDVLVCEDCGAVMHVIEEIDYLPY